MSRFMNELTRLNKIGYKSEHGINRLAFTQEDLYLREEIKLICKQLDLTVVEDGAGNIWARKDGSNNDLPSVLMGSHIDSVKDGGGYDGHLGVMAGIEVLRIMKENNIENNNPIEVIVFSVEESSRFNISTVGSKLITEKLEPQKLKKFYDEREVSLYDEMISKGYNPNDVEDSKEKLRKAKAFIELHIEQGPILENKKKNTGIVEGIAAPTRLKVHLYGSAAHSGSCPMDMRKDALTAASEIILAVEHSGKIESVNKTVATVGRCDVLNSAMNIVPGEVELFIDIRGVNKESVVKCCHEILFQIISICKRRELKHSTEILCDEDPVVLDDELNLLVKQCCEDLELSYELMQSGAGHDTMNIADVVKSTLVFIPCIDGVSHNKREAVKDVDVENGIKLLYKIIEKLACVS